MSTASETPELLDRTLILNGMNCAIRARLSTLRIEPSLDSTNSELQRIAPEEQHATAILAEHQARGRGRRGRNWHSPHGRNLYLSLGWRFEQALSALGCLPLVVALSVAKALSRAGLKGHWVKWPNDILINGRKLCGCLVEIQGDAQGPIHAVLGVGINVHMTATDETNKIDQPWTDLTSHLPACSRNGLATLVLEELMTQLPLFSSHGFAVFRDAWEQVDGLRGKSVHIESGNHLLHGTVAGIDEHGALMLDNGREVLILHSGEVSVKID
jgi:BirA family biotin operon repressor/biotin-[acetyl-CoA-carboxylase] ligase